MHGKDEIIILTNEFEVQNFWNPKNKHLAYLAPSNWTKLTKW